MRTLQASTTTTATHTTGSRRHCPAEAHRRWIARPGAYLIAVLIAAAALMTACAPVHRAQGATRSTNPVSNPAYAGQCTWAVEELWRQATGSYLAERGDAWEWASVAANYGWTVTSTPSSRSIAVFGRGVAGAHTDTGHVAWVTAVSQRADGIYIDVTEMNWTYGPNNWDTRTLKTEAGMSYILAP